MSRLIADISMSLDGFITGPNDSVELGLGEGGERLHEWMFEVSGWREPHGLEGGSTGTNSDVAAEMLTNKGAVIMGRRMFDLGEGAWGDNPPYHVPVFVLTHHPRETVEKEGGTTYNFVTGGIESALEQARAAAGDKDIYLAGGANIIQQYLSSGLLDDLQIHLVPILLGDGRRLFEHIDPGQVELQPTRVIDSPGVTHLRYRVVPVSTPKP
ncbi:MAG TPA: dihydrofolate reductase family protein [Chloroflexia bacterium]|nr:dihydrofolate reductase family protein [Chloroflexia bacterium]